jgi:hypothetical protein
MAIDKESSMRADHSSAPLSALIFRLLITLAAVTVAALPMPSGAAPPPPPPPSATAVQPPPAPPPAYPDLSGNFISASNLQTVQQVFNGTLKRHGRLIYTQEESSSSGPISYDEYYIFDFDKNMVYRVLRDEHIYFETPLTLEQRVDAIRKGWVPAEGVFPFNNVNVTLSSRDVPLRPDTLDGRRVDLMLREISAEIPAVGSVPARTVKSYTLVWRDPVSSLPVKIAYGTATSNVIVEFRDITLAPVEAEIFTIPKDFVNLTPY